MRIIEALPLRPTLWCLLGGLLSVAQSPSAAAEFERDIAVVLIKRCLECHNPREAAGGLVLTTRQLTLQGGDSGEVLVPGDPTASEIIRRINSSDDDRMPPDAKGRPRPLPAAERAALQAWIAAGAPWPKNRELSLYERTTDARGGLDWWSLQPMTRPQPPRWEAAAGPIDAFLLERLAERGLEPAPQADRRTLIRRLYFDVLGIPPTVAEVRAFEDDARPDAWERLVDKALASPRFGQRWARYWLDLVRYADTSGYERDQPKPFAWRYRDWVIDAHNRDMPYNKFMEHQIAGDQAQPRTRDSVIATGFLRLGPWNDEPNDPADYLYDRLEDLVHASSTAFLGLTVKCARCHDHKFDPIPQADYYRLASLFWSGPIQPRDRKLLGGPSDEELGEAQVLGWTNVTANPAPFHLLKNGDRHQPREQIQPASLSFLPELRTKFPQGQGRRELARWLSDRRNPLPARVVANRLWLHHFGQGLVRTPNNFGFRGDKPTHPKLLDWLASEIVRDQWRLKRVHRAILVSQAYRMASVHPQGARYRKMDFDNVLWWRATRRRLDAETLRDSTLYVSGDLDERHGGEGFRPTIPAEATEGLSRKASAWSASPKQEQFRRAIYMYSQRSLLPPLMTAFDLCDSTAPCGQRNATTVAPQALALMNHPFQHERSAALARRVMKAAAGDRERVRTAWRFALGRPPRTDELEAAARFIDAQRPRFEEPRAASPKREPDAWRRQRALAVTKGLALHLSADRHVELDDAKRVIQWRNLRGDKLHASQPQADLRPSWKPAGEKEKHPRLDFDGQGRFLHIDGQVLTTPECTILAVVSDHGKPGHREIISNWNGGAGNATSSIFLGLTGQRDVRLSDQFVPAGQVTERQRLFLLTATNDTSGAAVFQNARPLASRDSALSGRRLDTAWVIGQQGNIQGEYWHGEIAEILVYDRGLATSERKQVWGYLLNKYGLSLEEPPAEAPVVKSPEWLTWTSLCQVLLGSNEFLYVD